jgi:hypothetical protein
MKTEAYAKAIKLERWQSPVEDVLLLYSEGTCIVYFLIQSDTGDQLDECCIGKLQFFGAHAVRSFRTEVLPYYDHQHDYHSYILEVFQSPWRAEALVGIYSEQLKASLLARARHFIVAGHDIYHEIVAESYNEQYITNNSEEFVCVSRELKAR